MDTIKSLEELQEDLQEVQAEKDAIVAELDELFGDAGFKKLDKMNNISYQLTKKEFKAQFSIEDTSFNYSCYITTDGDNSFNYTAKGTMDGITKAAYKFLEELDFTATNDDAVELDDDDTADLDPDLGEPLN